MHFTLSYHLGGLFCVYSIHISYVLSPPLYYIMCTHVRDYASCIQSAILPSERYISYIRLMRRVCCAHFICWVYLRVMKMALCSCCLTTAYAFVYLNEMRMSDACVGILCIGDVYTIRNTTHAFSPQNLPLLVIFVAPTSSLYSIF